MNFELNPHLQAMADELAAYGYQLRILIISLESARPMAG